MAGNNIGLTPQVLRPVAAPADTFIRTNAGTGLSQLAEGLKSLSPALGRFSQVQGEQQAASDQIAGSNKARAMIEDAKAHQTAVDMGVMEKHQSKWFRVGAYETMGRVSAGTYAEDLGLAFKSSDAAQSTNPKDFDTFEAGYRKTWTEANIKNGNDPFYQNAFGTAADSHAAGIRANFTQAAGAKLVQQNGEAFQAEIHQIARQFNAGTLTTDLSTAVSLAQARQRAGGTSFQEINQRTAEGISSAAIRDKNLEVLKLMDTLTTGKGNGKLAGTSYGSELIEKATRTIAQDNQNAASAAWTLKEHTEKVAVDAVTGDLVEALRTSQSPATLDLSPFIARVAKFDPDKAKTYEGMRIAFAKPEPEVDAVKRRLLIGIHTSAPGTYGYTSQGHLDKALSSGAINSATYAEFSAQIKGRDKEGADSGSKLFNDDGVKLIRETIKGNFAAERGDSTPENNQRANEAVAEATDRYLRWRLGDGKNTTAIEANKFIENEVNRVAPTKADKGSTQAGGTAPRAVFDTPLKDHPVTLPQVITTMTSELAHMKIKKGNAISAPGLAILRHYKVPPDMASIEAFLKEQTKLLPNYRPDPQE